VAEMLKKSSWSARSILNFLAIYEVMVVCRCEF
jgi:hypothetical protein